MHAQYEIQGGDFTKAGLASSEVKKMLKQLNLDPKIIKRIAVAMYEAEVNVVAHAYHGIMDIELNTEKIIIKVQDTGPGIADIDKAMEEGFSTASKEVREMGFGAGMGLPNIKKNADELILNSKINKGTEVKLVFYLNHQ
ncbi:MAG: ATP-binding protein [Bacteroidales bacterium]|nr:ATP-binding protein [Bacteroidales bacterium]